MSLASQEIISAPISEPLAEPLCDAPLGRRLHRLGRSALAIVGVTLALSAATSPAAASVNQIPQQTVTTNEATDPFAPQSVDLPVLTLPKMGVATGSWDDDGLGPHTLYSDMAAEGMTVARINWAADGNYLQSLPDIRAQAVDARANDIELTINLQQSLDASAKDYPQQAAQMAALLPGVSRFVPGNEWDSRFFSSLPAEDAMRVSIKAAQAIHNARPDATVIGPGLASDGNPLSDFEDLNRIADQCCGELENVFDVLDFHLYRSLTKNLQLLTAYEQDWEGPISIGEIGFPAADLKQQATDEVAFTQAVALDPQVQRVYWFKYRANPSDPFDTANVSADGTKRPAWYALKAILTGQRIALPASSDMPNARRTR